MRGGSVPVETAESQSGGAAKVGVPQPDYPGSESNCRASAVALNCLSSWLSRLGKLSAAVLSQQHGARASLGFPRR